ncbi:MAG TPA: aminotransferase [Caulobacteraceae bacterium]|jgi:aspartate/methionine/tyrosine aminotransferase|nr:aminotransferase [Caulobacteraceae bacterium]
MANALLSALPVTIFTQMSALARAHDAVNLGQGFPDEPGPRSVLDAAAHALLEASNQYPPMQGLAALRRAVADFYAARQGLSLDPDREITVTSGATEALAAAFLGLIEPGDEVVLFQPLYDSYLPMIRRAGGVARLARLEPPHWRIDRPMLERLFTPRTRLVVLNNPLNPAASVASAEDLALLAEFCVRHDAIAICDEVWEQVVFDGRRHIPLLAMPGMAERCVKIGSAGKMFALTGWKVGWMIACEALTASLARAHQFLTFTTAPNLQSGVAFGLRACDDWFEAMPPELARSRDRLAGGLRGEGFAVLDSEGTYFLNIDLSASGIRLGDRDFCFRAVAEAGVAAIPVSAFYETEPVTSVVRLCFAKRDATLDAGIERLARARELFSKASSPRRRGEGR